MGFAVTTYSDGAVGILSARIISLDQTLNLPESVTQLQVDEDRYNLFKNPATTIDQKILTSFVDPINTNKADIVTAGGKSVWSANEKVYSSQADATTALETLVGAVTNKDCVISDRQVLTVLNFNGTASSGIGTEEVPANPPAGSASIGAAVIQGGVTGKLDFAVSTTAGTTGRAIVRDVTGGDFTAGTPGVVGPPSSGVGTITIGGAEYYATSISYIGLGEVHQDVDVFHFYPNLEPPDPNVDDIFGSAENRILTSSNTGVGFANTFFPNGLNTSLTAPTPVFGVFVQASSSVPAIGDVYTFDTSTTGGTTALNTINTERQAIEDLRFGVVSTPNDVGVSSFNSASEQVKGLKKAHAIGTWSGKRMRVVATSEKGGLQAAIQVLSDPTFQ